MSERNRSEMLFIGVSTQRSFVHKVFPSWCRALGVEADLRGVDLPVDSAPSSYRMIVEQIKNDTRICGALVTTHKMALFEAAHYYFDHILENARDLREAGAIFRNKQGLACEATDPPAVLLAVKEILRRRKLQRWEEVLIMGGGGAGLALAYSVLQNKKLTPKRLVITDIAEERLRIVRDVLDKASSLCQIDVILGTGVCDSLVRELREGALIVNATGMGKDRPGSPISRSCDIPRCSTLWDFNYRGERLFLVLGRRNRERLDLILEDGWYYFICGWYQVMSRVFAVPVTAALLKTFVKAAEEKRVG